MMKKVLVVLLLLALIVALAACGYGTSATVPPDDTHAAPTQGGTTSGDVATVVTEPEPVAESELVTVEPVVEPTAAPVVEPEPVDPFAALVVSEEFARENGGWYVRRDGKLYAINKITRDVGRQHGFGKRYENGGPLMDLYDAESRERFVSFGEVPVMTLLPTDELLSFAATQISFCPAEFLGYTISLMHHTGGSFGTDSYFYVDYGSDPVQLSRDEWANIEIRDANGNLVEDYRNLVYGEIYTVGWYSGVQYKEVTLPATCSYYYSSAQDAVYSLVANLTHDGYGWFDFSGVPAGLYRLSGDWGAWFIRVG